MNAAATAPLPRAVSSSSPLPLPAASASASVGGELFDLRTVTRLATQCRMAIAVAPTKDGQGIVIRPASTALWISTREAMARTGLSRTVLYSLGRRGLIVGEQPNLIPGEEVREDGQGRNCHWKWLATSVQGWCEAKRRGRMTWPTEGTEGTERISGGGGTVGKAGFSLLPVAAGGDPNASGQATAKPLPALDGSQVDELP